MNDWVDHCDLLIVGAGPAGLSAAQAAAEAGVAAVVLDDNPRPGGQVWRHGPGFAPPRPARPLLSTLARPPLRYLPGTRIVDAPEPGVLLVEDEQRGWLLRYRQLILCCGARELLLPFPGWTLPGVTGVGALQALVKGGMPLRGERVVVAGSGPLLLASAATARQAGATVVGMFEQAPLSQVRRFALNLWRWPGKAAQAAALARRGYRPGAWVVEALGTDALQAVRVQTNGRVRTLVCDRLACAFGLVANTELASMLGCQLSAGTVAVGAGQRTSVEGVYAAGECTGVGGNELARVEGRIAGLTATGRHAEAAALAGRHRRWQAFARQLQASFELNPAIAQLARPDTLLCRCEDVSVAEVAGHTGWAQAKLHTRCGMGACQGRVCGTAARALFGWGPGNPRAPLVPARVATLGVYGTGGTGDD
ncbi:NAD(P)/FAD-dependent oxidoreductase [Pseudomonas typographi]|uniref:FAD-dependent oxidoreductase n=1 Tax=Pseudomonas typographi TaxID=2715964 RepID=A0ABR7YWM9_9PSED|nr:FAD/NAD(P)-binding oxidoreductase [Pseudomonas typographi]MBD1585495.1 FAD-dependent oxidoreductase [Pseudomonas typographi]MBD1597590.1 FAD-dependent oxidoreductase [Pseudomonas typographi]